MKFFGKKNEKKVKIFIFFSKKIPVVKEEQAKVKGLQFSMFERLINERKGVADVQLDVQRRFEIDFLFQFEKIRKIFFHWKFRCSEKIFYREKNRTFFDFKFFENRFSS